MNHPLCSSRSGVLLFAHGARDPQWRAPFDAIARQLKAKAPQSDVVLAFLEFMTPDFDEAVQMLLSSGCQQIDVVPLFLGSGGHVRKDVPALLERWTTAHPDVRWSLTPSLGEMPIALAGMTEAIVACLRGDWGARGGVSI